MRVLGKSIATPYGFTCTQIKLLKNTYPVSGKTSLCLFRVSEAVSTGVYA